MRFLICLLMGCLVGSTGVTATTYSVVSNNWAGYAVARAGVTGAAGTWTVPAVSGYGYSSVWVGVGGLHDGGLVQAGTEQNLTPYGLAYFAWWEALPGAQRVVLPVEPGDTVHASVREVAANLWRLRVLDETSGQGFTHLVRYRSSGASAEWVVEDPSQWGGGPLPLADFGAATFRSAGLTLGGSRYSPAQLDNLALSIGSPYGPVLAAPGPLTRRGGFTVSYAPAAAPAEYVPPAPILYPAPAPTPDPWVRRWYRLGFGYCY